MSFFRAPGQQISANGIEERAISDLQLDHCPHEAFPPAEDRGSI